MEVAALPKGFIFKHPRDYAMAEVTALYLHLYNSQEGLSNPPIRFSWLSKPQTSKGKRRCIPSSWACVLLNDCDRQGPDRRIEQEDMFVLLFITKLLGSS